MLLWLNKHFIRCLLFFSARWLRAWQFLWMMSLIRSFLWNAFTAQILDDAAVCTSAKSDWNASWMGLIGVRSCAWVNKLMLYHLLEQFFVIRTHIVCFCKAINKLLTQRWWWLWTSIFFPQICQLSNHWVHSCWIRRTSLNIISTFV